MPEAKNNFFGAKMNKDLDDRLVPSGEFRNALNIEVSKSDSSDVGVAKNILGNTKITAQDLGSSYKIIGYKEDQQNNRIFAFLSDNSTNHSIVLYDGALETITTIASGTFLNFDHDYRITGCDVLENMLFWNDDLNQPRAINIDTAIADPTFYDSEIKISLAKYAPPFSPKITAVRNDTSISSDFIEEEFIRIGYRYKFVDNQYSVFSPFTAMVFKMESNVMTFAELAETYKTTELTRMLNGINSVDIQLPVPSATPLADYEIEEIDILMKKSGDSAVYVLDTVEISGATIANQDFDMNGSNEQPSIEYTYESSRQKFALAEDQLIRVNDKVPIKAKAQAIISNRVAMGNVTMNTDTPSLDYTAFYSPKTSGLVTHKPMLENQTVKSRRQYQVGVVLSDIHGRSTPVLLSKNSTIYVDAKEAGFDSSTWDGDSIKMVFSSTIPNSYNASTNPLGWYSFKIVVKQPEQEYYNVYTSGAISFGSSSEDSYIKLASDNINKVPRDTSGGRSEDDIMPSLTKLWPKVVGSSTTGNAVGQSDGDIIDIVGIGDQEELGVYPNFNKLPNSKAGDFLANLATNIGQGNLGFNPTLTIFETEPFESSIDIYYETPTCGLVSQINDNINDVTLNDWSIASGSITYAGGNVPESTDSNVFLATLYAFSDVSYTELEPGSVIFILNSGGVVSSKQRYTVVKDTDGRYKIKLNKAFMYNSGDTARTLNITAKFGGIELTRNVTFTETDAVPIISGATTAVLDPAITPVTPSPGVTDGIVSIVTAINGSSCETDCTDDLTFSIVSAVHDPAGAATDVSSSFGILSNYREDVVEDGAATLYVSSSISALDDTKDIEFNLRASDSYGSTTGNDLVLTVDLLAGGSDPVANAYDATWTTFSSATEADAVPTTDGRWQTVTIYIAPSEDPFAAANSAYKIYRNESLTLTAYSGWYRTTSGATGRWNQVSEDWDELIT